MRGKSGIRLEKERSGEGREEGREVGEINSKESCGWMTGNKTVEPSVSNVPLCVL